MIIWSIVLCILLVISVILFFQLLDKYGWTVSESNIKNYINNQNSVFKSTNSSI